MTFAVTNVAVSLGSNNVIAVLTDPFGRAATSTVAVTVRDTGYAYDANGNLTNDGERAYAWDEENRLIEVRDLASGQPLMRSRYDGLSRRRERVQWAGGVGTTNRYIYDGWNVVRVLDGVDNVLESYVHGPDLSGTIGGAGGIGGILSVVHAGEPWRFYHADGNGNIALLTDEAEQESARLEYDPFGRVLINTGGAAIRYQFSSKEYDGSVGLNYYGYRFYSSNLGRWINRDPLSERAFRSLYMRQAPRDERLKLLYFVRHDEFRFVGNNSVLNIDPHGLQYYAPNPNNTDPEPDVISTALCLGVAAARFAEMKAKEGSAPPGSDRWYHCVTSCEMTKICGENLAKAAGDLKEQLSDNADDSREDQVANEKGRSCGGRCNRRSCAACCEDEGYAR